MIQFIKNNKKNIFIIILCIISISFLINISAKRSDIEKIRNSILLDVFELQKLKETDEGNLKYDYQQKMILARQVYQFSWYKKEKTAIGDLQLQKFYAMDLQQYNDLIELSWKLNRKIGIPINSWKNYIMPSKWIIESAMCPWIEHKTEEIIKFAGYTEIGLRQAIFVYLHESSIYKGDELYIPEFFEKNLTFEEMKNLLNDRLDYLVKFDYAFIRWLLKRYEYKWDWALIAFHFGFDRTDYWWNLGLKEIPNFRLDGLWGDVYLRKYYQWCFEIAQGISLGKMARISKFEEIVGQKKKIDNFNSKYISTLKLKVKSQQKIEELEKEYNKLSSDFIEYKKMNEEIMKNMAELNDLNIRKEQKDKIKELKRKISVQFDKMNMEKKK